MGSTDGESTADDTAQIAFRRFVAARWNALQRYAYLLTGDQHAAEDVVQMALEKSWRHWRGIRSEAPEAYVRAAVANIAASRYRRRRFRESPLENDAGLPAVADHADLQAQRSCFWTALADLPPRRRVVVVLRLWEDLSIAETADVLGLSSGAVKSQLSKAMSQLRAHPDLRDAAGLGPLDPSAPSDASASDAPAPTTPDPAPRLITEAS